MARVIYISNPFEGDSFTVQVPGTSLSMVIGYFLRVRMDLVWNLKNKHHGVLLNGRQMETGNESVGPDDEIRIIVALGGVETLAAMAFKAVAGYLFSMVVSKAFGKDPNRTPKQSPTYGWDRAPIAQEGDAVPLIFGKIRVTPGLISAFIENVSNSEYKHFTQYNGYFSFSDQVHSTGWEFMPPGWGNSFTVNLSPGHPGTIKELDVCINARDKKLKGGIDSYDDPYVPPTDPVIGSQEGAVLVNPGGGS